MQSDILVKPLKITGIKIRDKIYDGDVSAEIDTSSMIIEGLVTGDDFVLTSTGSFSDKNVAIGKSVSLNNQFSGTDVNNYQIEAPSNLFGKIMAKDLFLNGIQVEDRSYDGTS